MHRFSTPPPPWRERVIVGYGFEPGDPCPCCDRAGLMVLVGSEITCLCCWSEFPLHNVVRWSA